MFCKIYNYIKGIKGIVKDFQLNAKYMCSGLYVFDDTLKYLARDDDYTKARTSKIFKPNFYSKASSRLFVFLLQKTLFKKKISIQQQSSRINEFSGSVYLPIGSTAGYRDKKIFDLTHNKVLSIFTHEEDYMAVISNYQYFKNYFPIPATLWTKDEELLVMEELILFKSNKSWLQEDYHYVMTDIFDRYYQYFISCKTRGMSTFKTPFDVLHSFSYDSEVDFIRSKINPELLHLKIPCVKLHGDLWTSNILLEKSVGSKIHYIDWEFSKELVFFYDFFNMMWLEVYMNKNYLYVKKYINGDYNHEFTKIFSLFNLEFKENFRLAYFNIFFLSFYEERLRIFEETAKQVYFNQYKKLLEDIDLLNGGISSIKRV